MDEFCASSPNSDFEPLTQGRGLTVIYVSKDQLKQVEYLIGQSIQGNHVLFDTDTVRRVFWNDLNHRNSPLLFEDETAHSIEQHIEKLIIEPTLQRKRAYLEHLDPSTYEMVVRTYFNIVENNLYENIEVRH